MNGICDLRHFTFRMIIVSNRCRPFHGLRILFYLPGLAPQAICCRLLRRRKCCGLRKLNPYEHTQARSHWFEMWHKRRRSNQYSPHVLYSSSCVVRGECNAADFDLMLSGTIFLKSYSSKALLPNPHFLFGCAPMMNTRVEPLVISACLINGSFRGFPLSVADWIYLFCPD